MYSWYSYIISGNFQKFNKPALLNYKIRGYFCDLKTITALGVKSITKMPV